MNPFWNSHLFVDGETRYWALGQLEMWVRRLRGEWQIAHRYSTEVEDEDRWSLAEQVKFPSSIDFERFAFSGGEENDRLWLNPSFPDRPIVVRPESKIVIPPGCQTRFFSGVPLSVCLSAGPEKSPTLMARVLTRGLSKTWFGTPQEGESCYGTQTRAVLDPSQLRSLGFRVLCPLTVVNDSAEPLPIERLCIRVRHLSIYQGAGQLWSNEAVVRKVASHIISDITFSKGAPQSDPDAVLVQPAFHQAPSGSLIARSFNNIKHIVDLT